MGVVALLPAGEGDGKAALVALGLKHGVLGKLILDGIEGLAELVLDIELSRQQPLLHSLGDHGTNLRVLGELGGIGLHKVEVGRQVEVEVVYRAQLGHLAGELAFGRDELLGLKLVTQVALVGISLLGLAALDGAAADYLTAVEERAGLGIVELQRGALGDGALLVQALDNLGGHLVVNLRGRLKARAAVDIAADVVVVEGRGLAGVIGLDILGDGLVVALVLLELAVALHDGRAVAVGARGEDDVLAAQTVAQEAGEEVGRDKKGPSRDWLSIVKSTQAKNKINQWFKKEFKEENIVRGKEMLATYCKAKGFVLSDLMKLKYMQIVQEKYGFKDWDSILAALGHGGLKEGQIVNRLAEEYSKDHRKELTDESVLEKVAEAAKNKVHITRSKSGIVVKGIDDMAVRFSRCCNPVPGDEIVGFITRGRGMSIHRTDCVNIIHLSEAERARLIPAEWEKPEEGTDTGSYLAEIKMYANDRQGLLMDMSKVFTEMNIDVKSMNVRTSKQGTATIEAGFIVRGREELGKVIGKLRQIVGVLDIERAVG